MPYIDVISYERSEGELREIYDDLIESRGKLAEVHQIQSLNPKSITNHMDLYMTIMFGKSPLKRWQREMIAVVVSKSNDCEYCQQHHGSALLHYWKDESRVEQLKLDFNKVEDLSDLDRALCFYAQSLTLNPSKIDKNVHINKLKDLGLEDRAILDAALVTAYFNFVNRLVLGLGVHLEEHQGAGFKY